MDSNTYWIGPLVLTLLRVLYTEARLSHVIARSGALVFRMGVGGRLLLLLGIVGFSLGTLASIGREQTWLLAMGTGFVILGCFAWPATITLEDNLIRSTVWWKPSTTIPWNQVSGIEKNAGGDIQVFSNHGQCITFTRFHVDPTRFQTEVLRRAGLRGVMSASEPPTLRIP